MDRQMLAELTGDPGTPARKRASTLQEAGKAAIYGNRLKEEVAEILLIDEHHLTPGQKHRMRDAIAEKDINYFRHCIQM